MKDKILAKLVPVTFETHYTRSWRGSPNFSYAAQAALVDIALSELPKLTLQNVIVFARDARGVRPVALLGTELGRNLSVNPQGAWIDDYIPVSFKMFPFALLPTSKGEMALCVDEESGLVLPEGAGLPFFGDDGALGPLLKEVLSTLSVFESEKQSIYEITARLDGAGVIKQQEITLPSSSGFTKFEDLLVIDEASLNALSDEATLSLRGAPLMLAYCQMLSMHNLEKLARRAESRRAAAVAPSAPAMELDFSRFGG